VKTIQRRFQTALLMGAAASMLAFATGAMAQYPSLPSSNDNPWPYATTGASPVLAVVGDIACQPGETEPGGEKAGESCDSFKSPYTSGSLWQSQEATANQIENMQPAAVALLGDLQYQVGQYSDFEGSFDLTYGAFKYLQRPAPGNHEFYDEHSATGVGGYGYFAYYNGFMIDNTGAPVTATITDRLSGRHHSYPPTRSACGWTGGALRGAAERSRSRSRRWLVLVQSRLLAPDFAQCRVLDAAGRLFQHVRHLV